MIVDAWVILAIGGHPALLCLVCKKWSYHPKDIEQRFCGGCQVFLDTIPRDLPGPVPGQAGRDWVRQHEQTNWAVRSTSYREERIINPLLTGGPSQE